MNTTAGSYTLLKSIIPEDSGVVKKLRQAGAIILGKSSSHTQLALSDLLVRIGKVNLSEWAHFRGNLASGWSGRADSARMPIIRTLTPADHRQVRPSLLRLA